VETLFIAGVYGVGKSTLCSQLSKELRIPSFSAGDLISTINGEQYGANKAVSDKISNQNILAVEVYKRLQVHPKILLAGHFCIFNRQNQVDCLPRNIYSELHITQILLLESSTERILENLSARDHRIYTHEQISELKNTERIMAQKISTQIGCNLHIHKMLFDKTDLGKCLSYLKGD
jgi:adenylate kinase